MAENNRKFVIQKHSRGNEIHWDLMLKAGNILETYRLPLPPEKISSQPVEAIKIFDHPLKFLTYEGSVNKGKGTVEIADSGIYQILSKTDSRPVRYSENAGKCSFVNLSNGGSVVLQFDGKILKGKFTFTLIEKDRWEFAAD